MLTVECKGSPYEIGNQHGSQAKAQVIASIEFYAALFEGKSKQSWPEVTATASAFRDNVASKWPAYLEEMQGIADGAGVDVLDIVALNVRTEIAFGQFSDGCTAISLQTEKRSFLGQNWDWMEAQKPNLIITKIVQEGKPTIQQVTEAGILGKIGFNSAGVGVCLNAIRIKGVDSSRLPVHLGLRVVLESSSTTEAVQRLEDVGIASAAHMLIADGTMAVGLECTASTFARCKPDQNERIVHANHMLEKHEGHVDTVWLKDSPVRVSKMTELSDTLVGSGKQPTWEEFSRLFEDESNYPTGICRAALDSTGSATLFNIVMDLKGKTAVVRLGKPIKTEETISLSF